MDSGPSEKSLNVGGGGGEKKQDLRNKTKKKTLGELLITFVFYY